MEWGGKGERGDIKLAHGVGYDPSFSTTFSGANAGLLGINTISVFFPIPLAHQMSFFPVQPVELR